MTDTAMADPTFEEQWQEFFAKMCPGLCPESQRVEMQVCFFSGGHAMLCEIEKLIAKGIDVTREDLMHMMTLRDELTRFKQQHLATRLLDADSDVAGHG